MRFGSYATSQSISENRATPVWVFIGQGQEVEGLRNLLLKRRSCGGLFQNMSSAARTGSSASVLRTQLQRLLKPRRSPGGRSKFQPEALLSVGSGASNFNQEALQTGHSAVPETSVSKSSYDHITYRLKA